MIKEKDASINLIKIVACILVVVLHVIENGGGKSVPQLCIYLLGTFGIPLFFMVNGYLLYDREFTWKYVSYKILNIVKFITYWGILFGLLKSLLNRKFAIINVWAGAFIGKGRLYNLWFLTALAIVYLGAYIINQFAVRGGVLIQNIISKGAVVVILISLTIVFITDITFIVNKLPEIRDLILAPFRIITSFSYFFLGMIIHKFYDKLKDIALIPLVVCFSIGFVSMCIFSVCFKMYWASSFYDSIFVVVGCCALFILCIKQKEKVEKYFVTVNTISTLTIGVWILHPFVWTVANEVLSTMSIPLSLPIRLIALLVVILISTVATFIAMKIPFIKKLFMF